MYPVFHRMAVPDLLEQVILPISPSSGKVRSCEHRHDQVHPIEGQDRFADIDTVEDVP